MGFFGKVGGCRTLRLPLTQRCLRKKTVKQIGASENAGHVNAKRYLRGLASRYTVAETETPNTDTNEHDPFSG